MPFCLRNSNQTFQRLMDNLMQYFDFLFDFYLDNILRQVEMKKNTDDILVCDSILNDNF